MQMVFANGIRRGLVAACLAAGIAPTCEAFWLDAFIHHVETGAKKNERWPSPYVCPDRVYAHAAFNQMVSNGWRRQNLLGSHHFNRDSTQLTQAGELKVRWIMTQAPVQYRRVFIERSLKDETTQARIATATTFAELIARDGEVPQVAETHIVSEGRPAATVDYVNTQYRDNMRVPVLPVNTGESE